MSAPAIPVPAARTQRWESNPGASLALRVFIAGAPTAAGLLAVLVLGRLTSPGDGIGSIVMWWAGSMVLAVAAALATRRVVRRLAPLETLLRINIAFPGAVPSRYKMARRINASSTLAERVAHAEEAGRTGGAGAAAAAILELVFALGDHDAKTRGHSERTRILTDVLADEMGLSAHDKDRLRWASLLHDVGKLSVRSETLKQARKLTAAEWDEVKAHPEAGLALIGPLADWLGEWKDAIPHHHERFDGGGYPAGLAGTEISLAGRIVAVADAFEVMTAGRSYQTPRSMRDALTELTECAGGQFDPVVVRAFLGIPVRRLGWVLGPSVIAWQIPVVNTLWPRLGSFLPAQPVAQMQQGVAVAALSGALVTGGVAALPAGAERGSHDVSALTEQVHEGPVLRAIHSTDPARTEAAGAQAPADAGAPGQDVAAAGGASPAGSTDRPTAEVSREDTATATTAGPGTFGAAHAAAAGGSLTDVEAEREAREEAEEEAAEQREREERDAERQREREEKDREKAEEDAEKERERAERDAEREERERAEAEEEAREQREREEREAERAAERAEREAAEQRERAEREAAEQRERAEREAERQREREEKDREKAEKADD